MNVRNKKWATNFEPFDELTPEYSKAYVRHLFASGEMLGPVIASLQNLRFYLWLVREARNRILDDTFVSWKEQMLKTVNTKLS